MTDNWWSALGNRVPVEGLQAAFDLCVGDEGHLPPAEAQIILNVVRHEIEHDNPERAFKTLRRWVSDHTPKGAGNEIFVMRVLAVLCCPPVPVDDGEVLPVFGVS